MKKFSLCFVLMIIVSIFPSFTNKESNKNYDDFYLSILYTEDNLSKDKNKEQGYIGTYGIYDLVNKKYEKIYSREKEDFSDITINRKENILFFSDRIDGKDRVQLVDLSKKENNVSNLVDGDMIYVHNNTLFFRFLNRGKDYRNFLIGTYDLKTSNINRWNENEKDSTIYDFYVNPNNEKLYSVEFSVKESVEKLIKESPDSKIFEYSKDGKMRKQIFKTTKFINSASVNSDGSKILLDAINPGSSNAEDQYINKIYLVDINNSSEEIMLKPNDKFGDEKFDYVKNPMFSPDEKGFFFLGVTSNSKVVEELEGTRPIMENAIYYYEFSTKNITKIFEKQNAVINRFKLEH